MTPRRKRLAIVGGILLGVGAATAIATQAFEDNLLYFYDPSQILAGEAPVDKKFRIGGVVSPGSIERTPGSLEVRFVVTDNAQSMPVVYSGLLPDLFREGQGVIAHGRLEGTVFRADEILAKHDENYMPPEVKDSLKPHADAQNAMAGTGEGYGAAPAAGGAAPTAASSAAAYGTADAIRKPGSTS